MGKGRWRVVVGAVVLLCGLWLFCRLICVCVLCDVLCCCSVIVVVCMLCAFGVVRG